MMEEYGNIDEIEDLDFCDGKPTGERWPPLGANDLDEEPTYLPMTSSNSCYEVQRLRDLEEQQELLNSSLIALTSHFAQVQFRLRQIVDAPATEKEDLLKDLEVFAFRGIPEVCEIKLFRESLSHHEGESLGEKIIEQRTKQKELISQLKLQLEDLEKYAYETGEAGLPQCVILERQKVILGSFMKLLSCNGALQRRNSNSKPESQLPKYNGVLKYIDEDTYVQLSPTRDYINIPNSNAQLGGATKSCATKNGGSSHRSTNYRASNHAVSNYIATNLVTTAPVAKTPNVISSPLPDKGSAESSVLCSDDLWGEGEETGIGIGF
uniref:RUN domain-containing protein n=1 Tax=Timema poppense TaxID=170557 RepID=A0A7R9H0W4_TIMPO|nr:unnamed protein product [Timema poppensis]